MTLTDFESQLANRLDRLYRALFYQPRPGLLPARALLVAERASSSVHAGVQPS